MEFKKDFRLRARREFLRLRRASIRIRRGPVTLQAAPNEMGRPRVGVTIRNCKTAVVRNRLKRWGREIFRSRTADLKAFDFNLIVDCAEQNKQECAKIRQVMESVWDEFQKR